MFTRKNLIILVFIAIIYYYFTVGHSFVPVNDLAIVSGVGYDIKKISSENVEFDESISIYNFRTLPSVTSLTYSKYAKTLKDSTQNRQLMLNEKFILGPEKLVLCSEKLAKFSIMSFVDELFMNPNVNDISQVAVCKGKPFDIFNFKIEGYPSSADYINGIIVQGTGLNFFSDNYKVMDIFVRIDSEGRNLVLPFIDIKDNRIQITGMALFKKDKMVRKLNIPDSKILNILRETNVKGILNIQKNSKEYINYWGKSKRKVKCSKKDEKYKFTIDLSIIGDLVENNLFIGINNNSNIKEKFEKELSKKIEKVCNAFIEKMQNEYKVDCLDLGRVAAAKYGRNTGVDWNKIICDPEKTSIKIKVTAKIDKGGRGDY